LEDNSSLQEDLDRLTEWSRMWLLHFNPEKGKVMDIAHDVKIVYRLAPQTLAETECKKDLGVFTSRSLRPSLQCSESADKTISVLRLISRHSKTWM